MEFMLDNEEREVFSEQRNNENLIDRVWLQVEPKYHWGSGNQSEGPERMAGRVRM